MDGGVPGLGEVMVSRLHCPGPTGPPKMTEPADQSARIASCIRVPGGQPMSRGVTVSLRHFHPKEKRSPLVFAMQASYGSVLDSHGEHWVLQTLLKSETPKQDPWVQTTAEGPLCSYVTYFSTHL